MHSQPACHRRTHENDGKKQLLDHNTAVATYVMSDWVSTFPGYAQVLTRVKKCFGGVIRAGHTPRHIGIIMDGNRRYAKSHKIEFKEGHNMGFESMANILELLYESGVACVTVYAFSIENFKRLKYEVEWLMELAKLKLQQLCQHGDLCEQYGIRIKILGNMLLLPRDVREILRQTEDMTKNNQRAVLNVCFPYTSRDEMTHAVKGAVAELVLAGQQMPDINENIIERHLYTKDSPPLDLLVRTSGTHRLSDFLLWQCASLSCSIVFVDKLWPEFKAWDMCKVLINWGFNMYWYGHGSGATKGKRSGNDDVDQAKSNSTFSLYLFYEPKSDYNNAGTTGFSRYNTMMDDDDNDDDEDDEDDDEENKNELAHDFETLTSRSD